MRLLFADFETFFDADYTLEKLTTEEYVRDPRFKVHGLGVSISGVRRYLWTPGHVEAFLAAVPWHDVAVAAHNCPFDGAILSWVYGYRPALWLDTLSMARAVFPHQSHSLANLARLCGLGEKGVELASFKGRRDLSAVDQEVLGGYCVNDLVLTEGLFNCLKRDFPAPELRVIDATIRMFTEPVLRLDQRTLQEHYDTVLARKLEALRGLDLKALRSDKQFAELLRAEGVEPPTKVSAKTGKTAYAFAKTDEAMQSLTGHENPHVATLASARLGVKSTIEETRTERFLGISERGDFPVPLSYWGAQTTGRWAGDGKLNLQNLPRGGALRRAICAPPGHVLVVVDYSQVEARVLAWLADQTDLVQTFAAGGDPYCAMATRIYRGRPITKADKVERQLGKVVVLGCGYGMSGRKFASYLASGPLGSPPILFRCEDAERLGVAIPPPSGEAPTTTRLVGEDERAHTAVSEYVVGTYRDANAEIVRYWRACGKMLEHMAAGRRRQYGPVIVDHERVEMPNGLALRYPGLRQKDSGGWAYKGKRGKETYLYSSKLTENLVQSLSRHLIAQAMIRIAPHYRVVLTVHDELVLCVPEARGEEALAYAIGVMREAPEWARGCPLDAEGGIGTNYAEAK